MISQETYENPWISLMEYAQKHNVSLSTLRRRIKSHEVHFKLIDGKYYLPDAPISHHTLSQEEARGESPTEASEAQLISIQKELAELKMLIMALYEKL